MQAYHLTSAGSSFSCKNTVTLQIASHMVVDHEMSYTTRISLGYGSVWLFLHVNVRAAKSNTVV